MLLICSFFPVCFPRLSLPSFRVQMSLRATLTACNTCSNDTLNDPLLSRLGDNLLQLRSLDIRGCSHVSRNGAQALAARLADRWQTAAKGNAVQYDF